MDWGFHFCFEGCGGAGSVVLSLRRENVGKINIEKNPCRTQRTSADELA